MGRLLTHDWLPVSGCLAAPPELAYMFMLDGNHDCPQTHCCSTC